MGAHTKTQTCVANVYCLSPSLSISQFTTIERVSVFLFRSSFSISVFFIELSEWAGFYNFGISHCIAHIRFLPSHIHCVCSYFAAFICIFSHFYVTLSVVAVVCCRCCCCRFFIACLYFVYSFDYNIFFLRRFLFGHACTHFTITYFV